jgi:NADH-quinone oxidoreductase subunit H
MKAVTDLFAFMIFPGGLALLVGGLAYEWVDRKLVARFQNRLGPRWFQPMADKIKLLIKEEIAPAGSPHVLFIMLPVAAFAGVLTAALYTPIFGLRPSYSFDGDLIVSLYLLSLPTLCLGLAGSNILSRFSSIGATRTLTQLFSYEAPFLLAMLGPGIASHSWRIADVAAYATSHWLILSQPVGFLVALIGLMGKLELPPFDAPEAETEVVAGALTEYSGRGLALFQLSRDMALVVGLTIVAAFYLGGMANPLAFAIKTLLLLLLIAGLQTLLARLRIDQTVGLWWRYGVLLLLGQWLVLITLQVAKL